ncbi:MAG: DUF4149 domain-containing protein [Proteobacteria bacterium]|nr:DUF4149 domain-containing protein [Pseudomonadota bacterium]MDA1331822.1 DUF4149 domain-containing protein [Pseudomonadota bacterium]
MENISLLISGMVVGVIVFQTAIVAPVVFTALSGADSSVFLRKIFPRFFVLLATLGAAANIAAIFAQDGQAIITSGATVTFSVFAYLLIPMTNKSRDEGNEKAFKRLHLVSVLLTLGMLAINFASVFA